MWGCMSLFQSKSIKSITDWWWNPDIMQNPDIVRHWAIALLLSCVSFLLCKEQNLFLFYKVNSYMNFNGGLQQWTPFGIGVWEWCISFPEQERFSIQFHYPCAKWEAVYISPDLLWTRRIFIHFVSKKYIFHCFLFFMMLNDYLRNCLISPNYNWVI